ncbi:SRPBCC family protein [Peribacillus sp. NPDC096540]|uniref:SRPBCC family protein n=1 Tax=Peribacillus sp. NPDC096540 TaxID=3390612 RepID=UPI003D067CD5
MLAVIEKGEGGIIARFERLLNHPVEKVWAAITENDKLEKWMSNLEIEELGKEGTIKFNMNDGSGSSFDIKIRDFQKHSVLEFEWGDGWVRFELSPQTDGCLLVLKESIPTLSAHTSKDLAGWHVCLEMLSTLLAGHYIDFPKGEWEKLHEKYIIVVNQIEE